MKTELGFCDVCHKPVYLESMYIRSEDRAQDALTRPTAQGDTALVHYDCLDVFEHIQRQSRRNSG